MAKFLHAVRVCLALLPGVVQAATPSPPSRPNVLIVLIDDHPFNFTSVHQPSRVATPQMERLAARGTWFSRAYNDAPICCASRTAILTGVHSTRSGVYYNNHAFRRTPTFISKVTTLPAHFRAHGYRTIGYGKIAHNSFLADEAVDYAPGVEARHVGRPGV